LLGPTSLAHDRVGDVAIAVDHAPELPSKASAPEQPNRSCICKQSNLHGSAGALLTASCALPAARRDGLGVAGFVREGSEPDGSLVAALVAEQKSAEHSGARVRFVQSGGRR